ncbi:hypothetical protein [Aneurinibacillus migulanus]|uniref:Uncharacterized protein n=1 Tax=Aneurinibacillus migulanus TaxID=47500 RepID=A0A0M0G3U8_ANEMI|nr:hypothetical protein [Aneurinibacillus migulanus]KON84292.1 hypothetical protein AF333_30645 [Aneurinibacillus migulanus]
MANGDLIKLGTLYLGGVKQARPTRPWRGDSIPPGASAKGDIPSYSAGQTIEIRNTDASDAYKVQWREATVDGKKLLLCDRNILAGVEWSELNAQGLIFGKTITIDGKQYNLRVLTGGTTYRVSGDGYSGGAPISNEWDRIITNEGNFSGLPKPSSSDLDTTQDAVDLNSHHNTFWNWYDIYSLCQEKYDQDSATRSMRGFNSARFYSWGSGMHTFIGWRPVLEILNAVPTLTLSTQNNVILSEGSVLPITGSASDTDNGDVVTVKYKINSGTIRNITSGVVNGTPLSFAKNLTFSNKRLRDGTTEVTVDLAENVDHTLTVWAEDDKGGKSTEVTRKFRVIHNRPPVISGTNEDLGTIQAIPSKTYTVTEPEGDAFTVTEKIDGKVMRSFTGVAGQENTITIPHDMWIRLQPVAQHTLSIEATDSKGMTSSRTYTFVRQETKLEFKLKNPFVTDIAAKRCHP